MTGLGTTIAIVLVKRTANGGRARVRSLRSDSGDMVTHDVDEAVLLEFLYERQAHVEKMAA